MSDDARGTESDSETEIEYTVYEKRREVNVRKIVLLERLFSIAKQRLYHERLRQLETRQVELLNQTAADYINKKAVLLDEHRARSEYNTAFRTLQMESLRRKMVGKLETAHKNLIHNKKMAFERIEGEIKGRIAQMEKERKRCLDVIEQFALGGMTEEHDVQCTELQKLLAEGVAAMASGTALESNKPIVAIDITEEFFKECTKMKLGELAKSSNFQLSEAMSAIELMDPKMDIGMVPFDPSIRFENLVATGRLNITEMESRELIATMDAMLASLMSWLDGNSIAQTLLTCVCLHDVQAIRDATLASFCYAILELATIFRHIIQTAAVYEEEDFNGYFSSEIKTLAIGHLLNSLKTAENELQRKLREDFNGYFSSEIKTLAIGHLLNSLKTAENELQRKLRHKHNDAQLLEAISNRITFMRLIILSLSAIVPPPSTVSSGAALAQAFRPNLEDALPHIRTACSLLEKIGSTIALGLSAPNENDGDFAWLPAFEPEVNRRCLPPTFPRKTQMLSRVEGIERLRSLSSRILTITTELPHKITNIESTLFFLRSFSVSGSCVLSRSLLQLVYLPNDDRIMGRTHLSAVIIESLRLFAAPPILDPTCSLSSDSRCVATWDEFISDAVKVFLGVIQMFGLNLARQREKIVCCVEDFSALQNEVHTFIIRPSIKYTQIECSLSSDSRCVATWDEFISDAVKVFLGVIQMFGLNLARQREKIVCCVEDFSALQNEAERLEADFDACLGAPASAVTLSLTSFVLYHTLLLIEYHFYLSFRLDLFAPFEYPYVYWYMSEVVFKWLLNSIDRSHTLIISDYRKCMFINRTFFCLASVLKRKL
ncbi:N-alpha-acetyltransferase 35, NatC auxiliary subunit [Toxocara canis]|uniref:Protein MAK10 homolog n=1 Tax=Toxocara canis TaxID=6265 RepID=A0A0B2V322_TOXCA|nr:N-alpha-acetyltransferase 35, NatC auxiliary subunit [Toxocara canis]